MKHENSPSIKLVEEYDLIQGILCEIDLFKQFKNEDWELGQDYLLTINNEEIKIVFDAILETYIIFNNESTCEHVFELLQNIDTETSDNKWKESSTKILEKLKADNITLIKEGIHELKHWVTDYNNQYVDNSLNSANLSLFGYDQDNWEEGNLWPNLLFDNLLEKHKNELNSGDLLCLIQALFNKNEDYMDCKATYISINYLLENRTPEIEGSIVRATINALEGYDPGHRYYERSLLDRLVDDIFPAFSPDTIIELLQNLHPDNIKGEYYGGHGDNFISLAHVALGKNISTEQKGILEELIQKHTN